MKFTDRFGKEFSYSSRSQIEIPSKRIHKWKICKNIIHVQLLHASVVITTQKWEYVILCSAMHPFRPTIPQIRIIGFVGRNACIALHLYCGYITTFYFCCSLHQIMRSYNLSTRRIDQEFRIWYLGQIRIWYLGQINRWKSYLFWIRIPKSSKKQTELTLHKK